MSKFTRPPQQGMTLHDLETLVDSMNGRNVKSFKLGDLEVEFFWPKDQEAKAEPAETAPAIPSEPKVEAKPGPDGLTDDEAALAYAST